MKKILIIFYFLFIFKNEEYGCRKLNNLCSKNGICTEQGFCKCFDNYFGEFCEISKFIRYYKKK